MTGPSSRRIALRTGLSYHVLEWPSAAPGTPATPETGAAGSNIVVLLHGFLDFAWTWEQVVRSGLEGRYHIVAPDLRGHGDSDRIGPGGYYHFMDYLADVHDLIEQVAGSSPDKVPVKVSIVGHSMGGTVAGYYAGAYPERVQRLVLLEGLGPPAGNLESTPERIGVWVSAWRRAQAQPQRPMASLQEAAERLRRHDPRLPPETALALAEHGTSVLADGKRLFKHDPLHLTPGPLPFMLPMARAFWRRIECPVLLVDAEQSEFKYAEADFAERLGSFKDARTAVLADAGHMMQRHQPAALAALLRDFLG